MFNAIRRVISESSEVGGNRDTNLGQSSSMAPAPESKPQGPAQSSAAFPDGENGTNTVVVDTSDIVPLTMVHSVAQSDNFTTSSSLSDRSPNDGVAMELDAVEEENVAAIAPTPAVGKEAGAPAAGPTNGLGGPTLGMPRSTVASMPMTTSSSRFVFSQPNAPALGQPHQPHEIHPRAAHHEAQEDPMDLAAHHTGAPDAPVAASMAASAALHPKIHTAPRSSAMNSTMLQRMDSTNESMGSSISQERASSHTSSRDWGYYTDLDGGSMSMTNGERRRNRAEPNGDDMIRLSREDSPEAAAMAVTAPNYVLEESLSSQRLWRDTAGQRPPQPVEERAFYERMWAQNFARSQVNYSMPVEVLTAASPASLNPFAEGGYDVNSGGPMSDYTQQMSANSRRQGNRVDLTEATLISRMNEVTDDSGAPHQVHQKDRKSDGDLTVLLRGQYIFSTTVSKSFARYTDDGAAILAVDSVNISIASYRVVQSKKDGKFAQFLVIYREGSIRDTYGVWKRYRDFEELAHKVTQAHEGCAAVIANMSPLAVTEEPETEHLPNAITSWRLLKKRKRWYRCLDAGYLHLKVFFLERFLHDILFESSSPKLLRDFVLGRDQDLL